jgi:hypothetical protein
MKVEKALLDTLVPDPDNARMHPEENVAAIESSLQAFGQALPLVVHVESRIVIGGNGTVKAMRRLGWADAWIALFEGTLEQARALAIALNRTGELAEWDEAALGQSLVELQDFGFSHEMLGFSVADLEVMFPDSPQEGGEAVKFDAEGGTAPQEGPGLGNPVIQYALIFDTEEQQARWFNFMKWLKKRHPSAPTNAARLDLVVSSLLESETVAAVEPVPVEVTINGRPVQVEGEPSLKSKARKKKGGAS